MLQDLIIFIVIIIVIVVLISYKRENYTHVFSAYLYPNMKKNNYENTYQQMSRLPYILPPVLPYSLGWKSQQRLNEEFPTQSQLYNLLHPS